MEKIKQYELFEKEFQLSREAAVLENCCHVRWTNHESQGEYWVAAFRKNRDCYAVRIMPEELGVYQYEIHIPHGTAGEGELVQKGEFLCDACAENRHGRVRTREDGFVYQDGTKFLPFGTTCYAWTHQSKELQETTVQTLSKSCFNKIRMLLFPKFMPYNEEDPKVFPFEKDAEGNWNVNKIVPAYWDNLDLRLTQLGELGIEADLILFHPYDKWGFSELTQEASLTYVSYCIARLAGFSNVWWSLANEYELLMKKTLEDWDEYGSLLHQNDPYHHLISIHNILKLYPEKRWMTHLSIQSGNIDFLPTWKGRYELPTLIDECGYEGDIEYNWGNLSAFAMVDRFWWTITRGGYCTHGETFHREDEILWWGKGGVLYGESEPRIRFLKELLDELPGCGKAKTRSIFANPNEGAKEQVEEKDIYFQELIHTAPVENLAGLMDGQKKIETEEWSLQYFGRSCPCFTWLELSPEKTYQVEVIDVWNMTRKVVNTAASGKTKIVLPAKEGIAVLVQYRKSGLRSAEV